MKTLFNLTTCTEDLERYRSRAELLSMLHGFDGIELMDLGPDTRGIVPPETVVGLHMRFFPYWLDLWNGDTAACLAEFDSRQNLLAHYGGDGRDALVARVREDLARAAAWGAEYVVFHISDASVLESMTCRYRHTDAEVIDASCALLNEATRGLTGCKLLLENLWQPGLTFTAPDMTARLLEGIGYADTGLMLDTGHLMHTCTRLRTQREALAYIHRMLDAHGALVGRICGVHLNRSLTGRHMERIAQAPPALLPTYEGRAGQMFTHAFRVDRHRPFTCHGVSELVARIAPEYLTLELISGNLAQHKRLLARQKRALRH